MGRFTLTAPAGVIVRAARRGLETRFSEESRVQAVSSSWPTADEILFGKRVSSYSFSSSAGAGINAVQRVRPGEIGGATETCFSEVSSSSIAGPATDEVLRGLLVKIGRDFCRETCFIEAASSSWPTTDEILFGKGPSSSSSAGAGINVVRRVRPGEIGGATETCFSEVSIGIACMQASHPSTRAYTLAAGLYSRSLPWLSSTYHHVSYRGFSSGNAEYATKAEVVKLEHKLDSVKQELDHKVELIETLFDAHKEKTKADVMAGQNSVLKTYVTVLSTAVTVVGGGIAIYEFMNYFGSTKNNTMTTEEQK